MIAALEYEIRLIRWNILWMLRNKLGLTRDEAKRIFYRFRSPFPSGPEDPGGAPESPELREVLKQMHETSLRLDRMEKDLEYLKRQVDRILEKV